VGCHYSTKPVTWAVSDTTPAMCAGVERVQGSRCEAAFAHLCGAA
jgi:hypothetical protein